MPIRFVDHFLRMRQDVRRWFVVLKNRRRVTMS